MRLDCFVVLAFILPFSKSEVISVHYYADDNVNNANDVNNENFGPAKCLPIETVQSTIGDLTLLVTGTELEFNLHRSQDDEVIFGGQLGLDLPPELGQPTPCSDGPICWHWGSAAKLYIDQTSDGICYNVHWESNVLKSLHDCFDLSTNQKWFVGPEEYEQHFPLEIENKRRSVPFLPGDMLQDRYEYFGGVTEPYWLSSRGVALWLMGEDPNAGQPLFFSWNDQQSQKMCAKTKNIPPYSLTVDDPVSLSYKICSKSNAKEMHEYAVKNLLGLPEGIPDELMITSPIWSSWAQYKADINESVILNFARDIHSNGFSSSQIEIDDNWESCYGEATFNQDKFPGAAQMIKTLKDEYGFRVTLWIHPFINLDCPSWFTAATPPASFMVRDTKGKEGIGQLPGLIWWWQGVLAGYIDFTNPEAVNWWRARLESLRTDIGIDSFKFDAGEVNWMPSSSLLDESTSKSLWPALQTTKYVESVSHFGGQIEVRVGYRSQRHPIFVRMLDKDSRWGYDNGLKTLIPTLLQISMSGYPFVLPDMIGGNGYQMDDDPLHTSNPPTKELFVRWLQANTFMPAMQFSFVPWTYDDEVVALSKKFIAIHEDYAPTIIELAKEATKSGLPINRPIWWNDPEDQEALAIDSEFLLGDSVLVAPVLEEGAISRDIYLPSGRWQDQVQEGQVYDGPIWLRDYPAPLDTLPYFLKL